MNVSRRDLIRGLGAAPLVAGSLAPALLTASASAASAAAGSGAASAAGSGTAAGAAPATGAGAAAPSASPISLPDKASFAFVGTHLNAAYTHPVGLRTRQALETYVQARVTDSARNWPLQNARDEAVALFAKLIGADPTNIAVVPSTLEGENLVGATLGLGPNAGVVTDPFHYDASLIMYGELHKRGMPLTVIPPKDNRIDYNDLEAMIPPGTKLVAVSLVASATGYLHDLKKVCDIAHRKGALVYADIIQAAGAVPLDVKASGVDFCCAGTYKWLMGEFGTAFLYVRPDRLPELKRVQVGWRQIKGYKHTLGPLAAPDAVAGDYQLGTDTAQILEVSTPDWSGLAAAAGALSYIEDIGVERIARHREPLLRRLREELPKHGLVPVTPADAQGPYLVFAMEGIGKRFHQALKDEQVFVTLYGDKVRISASVYNDMADIDKVINIFSQA
jgi:selenocysteine lyase/cysteine desulfurase